jgi:histidinol-phosphate aminotransferase
MDGYGLPEYVRITVGTERENTRCLEVLAELLGK